MEKCSALSFCIDPSSRANTISYFLPNHAYDTFLHGVDVRRITVCEIKGIPIFPFIGCLPSGCNQTQNANSAKFRVPEVLYSYKNIESTRIVLWFECNILESHACCSC